MINNSGRQEGYRLFDVRPTANTVAANNNSHALSSSSHRVSQYALQTADTCGKGGRKTLGVVETTIYHLIHFDNKKSRVGTAGA